MAWRCKRCGCSDFGLTIEKCSKKRVEYDFLGNEKILETYTDDEYENVECFACGQEGGSIGDIANWEEE